MIDAIDDDAVITPCRQAHPALVVLDLDHAAVAREAVHGLPCFEDEELMGLDHAIVPKAPRRSAAVCCESEGWLQADARAAPAMTATTASFGNAMRPARLGC